MFKEFKLKIMEEKTTPAPIPLYLLLAGLFGVLGFAIWSGSKFYLYGGSILYGIAAGIAIGAAYAFLKQINLQRSRKQDQQK